MLFKCTRAALGKWKGWDHIKGRNKNQGAIHIRHTLGCRGRYPRLHGNFSIRDGRRHPGNRTQGGLGIKLGGGLFGMRVPRQHALSTLSRDEYDIEVYGHPNITNPYRDCLEQHPSLEKVRSAPLLKLTVIVALPHTPHRPQPYSPSLLDHAVSTSACGGSPQPEVPLPYWWERTIPEVRKWLRCDEVDSRASVETEVIFTTSHAAVRLACPPHADANDADRDARLSPPASSADDIHGALAALHIASLARSRTVTPRPLIESVDSPGSVSHALIDGTMVAVRTSLPRAKRLFSPPLGRDSDVPRPSSPRGSPSTATSSPCTGDVRSWLTSLQDDCPSALKLRTLLPLFHGNTVEAESYVPRGDAKHAAESVHDVLKWYMFHQDPRSHFNDLLSHADRQLHVRVLVECEKPVRTAGEQAVGDASAQRRSAVTSALNALLEKQGFRRTAETARELIPLLQQWSAPTSSVATIPGPDTSRDNSSSLGVQNE